MAVLGLLLVAAAAVLGVELVLSNDANADVEVFGRVIEGSESAVFLIGAACALVLVLGLVLMSASVGRMRDRRTRRHEIEREKRREMTAAESELAATRAENERLADELAEERRSRMTLGGVVPPENVPVGGTPGTAYDTRTYEPYPNDGTPRTTEQEHSDERGGVLGRLRGD